MEDERNRIAPLKVKYVLCDSNYCCLYGEVRNGFETCNIHYEGHWKGWALEIETWAKKALIMSRTFWLMQRESIHIFTSTYIGRWVAKREMGGYTG